MRKMVVSLIRGKQFYSGRLLKRLKEEYKRLSVCIQGDALYAVESVMELCRENGWQYIT